VVDTSLRASFLIGIVLLLRSLAHGRLPAQLLFCVWLAVALRLLLQVSIPASWSPFNLVGWQQGSSDVAHVPASLPVTASARFSSAGCSGNIFWWCPLSVTTRAAIVWPVNG
jgi:bla regulator protein blaR1